MPTSPIANATPGQPVKLSATTHNNTLEFVRRFRGGGLRKPNELSQLTETSTEIFIKNVTGARVGLFGILKLTDPLATDPTSSEFKSCLTMKGATPTADATIAVIQGIARNNVIVPAVVLGITPCQVNLTNTSHRYAGPAGSDTVKLASQGGKGPARILWTEDNFATTGTKWAIVLLSGTVNVKAAWARFTLPSALATTDASKAACTVDEFWGGYDPGSTITVYNLPASTNYIFSGASGHKGLATYNEDLDRYVIVQLQCP